MAYPTPATALQAAQAFCDAVEARLPDRRRKGVMSAAADDPTYVRRAVFGGKASWMIRMVINGKLKAKLFSVRKYGEEEARRLALAEKPAWLRDAGLAPLGYALPTDSEVSQIERKAGLDFGEVSEEKGARGYNDASLYGITRSEANADGQDGVWTVMIMRRNNHIASTFYQAKAVGNYVSTVFFALATLRYAVPAARVLAEKIGWAALDVAAKRLLYARAALMFAEMGVTLAVIAVQIQIWYFNDDELQDWCGECAFAFDIQKRTKNIEAQKSGLAKALKEVGL
jgi:hypothetical protein